MGSSNLPPGVTPGMIPGNTGDDAAWEAVWDWASGETDITAAELRYAVEVFLESRPDGALCIGCPDFSRGEPGKRTVPHCTGKPIWHGPNKAARLPGLQVPEWCPAETTDGPPFDPTGDTCIGCEHGDYEDCGMGPNIVGMSELLPVCRHPAKQIRGGYAVRPLYHRRPKWCQREDETDGEIPAGD